MKTTAEMTLGSLFDGIAGFPLAARRQGIKTVWVSEIEPDCIDIAKRHFPEALQLGDITQIDGAKIPVVDIISFGSPCQDLSVAGKQTGLDGSRSGLFMEAVRITREMREKTNGQYPKYIIWENVAGAFSSNKGEDFRRVLEEITQSNISMPKSGKWATAGMVGNEGPGGGVEELMDAEVKRFRPTPEIRHKEWRKRGLMAPLQPQETPEYSFSDLQMNLYNTIYL